MSSLLKLRGLLALAALLAGSAAWAGGGVILRDDVCIITIEFYEAHFTAYQPDTQGNTEFCKNLPDTGKTIFVLDYLHESLREVAVEFRVIRDVTGLGEFVRVADVEAIPDIDVHTVFHRPPEIEANGSYRVTVDFTAAGDYVGIVSAGHPTNEQVYTAVFPFSVGKTRYPWWILYVAVAGLFVLLVRYAYRSVSRPDTE